jgi:vitamin K-dependent gamma-carboxylase
VGSKLEKRITALRQALTAPVDVAALVAFRVMFGLVLVWESCRYFSHGWIAKYWIAPAFNLPYPGFGWLPHLPGDGMYGLWLLIGALALLVTLGAAYRVATVLLVLAFTYQFLLEQARYLNHFYFIILISGLMAIVPANRRWSVDAAFRPRLRSDQVPAWTLWLFRFQVGVMYFYAGVAKLGRDWLAGEPMGMWLAARTDFPILGPLFTHPNAGIVAAWLGTAVDLLAVPLLLYRRTRVPALIVLGAFHFLNARLFQIGVFPVLAMAGTLLYCEPDWPRRLLRLPPAQPAESAVVPPRRAVAVLLGSYVAVQLLVPLRHYVYPGDVNWTEEGHRFSWHMKLRTKSGSASFTVIDRSSGQQWSVDPQERLTSWQYAQVATHPEATLQYAHELARRWADYGIPNVEVHAQTFVSLNGRNPMPLVNPDVDLAAIDRCRMPGCILPLEEPLRR